MTRVRHLLWFLPLASLACSPESVQTVMSQGRGVVPPAPMSDCAGLATESLHRPSDFGRQALSVAIAASKSTACARVLLASDPESAGALAAAGVALDPRPESFAILYSPSETLVVGSDETGALYGALELAERFDMQGPAALPLPSPIIKAPQLAVRAANLFLTMKDKNEKDWWFHDPTFWTEYFDMMTRARLDVLDIHGMYNPRNTVFPNALLYFSHSRSFPQVGIPAPERERNVAMLKSIVKMASERGIRVALMSYRADASLTGDYQDFYLDDASLKQYTREAVSDLARNVPDLWRMGFRIGESQRGAAWFGDSFVAGLHDSGTHVLPYTRTWQTNKPEILSLVQMTGDDYVVEAKFNGEQLAAPYAIMGGSFANHSWGGLPSVYSYQDYLDPPAPYTFVFQVRSCSTHRIFREANYERARRTMETIGMGLSRGFTLEAPHAYYPQRDFYHQPHDRFSEWSFRRDEMMYLLFGRLGYDPETPESVFRFAFARRVGTDGLWDALQAAGDIVPWIQMASTCGPDTRDYAPDLEWGGTVAQMAQAPGHIHGFCNYHGPFDTFAVAGPYDAASDLVAGRPTSRLSPIAIARILDQAAVRARQVALSVPVDPDNAEARDVVRETLALSDLGAYFGHKLRAATALSVYAQSGATDYLTAARIETASAATEWMRLAAETSHISPFEEFMRMGQLGLWTFHWKAEIPFLATDPKSIDDTMTMVEKTPPAMTQNLPSAQLFLDGQRPAAPGLASFEVEPRDPTAPAWKVSIGLVSELPPGSSVRVLWKRYADYGEFATAATNKDGRVWSTTIKGGGKGAVFAIEIVTPDFAWRLPDVTTQTPYFVMPTAR